MVVSVQLCLPRLLLKIKTFMEQAHLIPPPAPPSSLQGSCGLYVKTGYAYENMGKARSFWRCSSGFLEENPLAVEAQPGIKTHREIRMDAEASSSCFPPGSIDIIASSAPFVMQFQELLSSPKEGGVARRRRRRAWATLTGGQQRGWPAPEEVQYIV